MSNYVKKLIKRTKLVDVINTSINFQSILPVFNKADKFHLFQKLYLDFDIMVVILIAFVLKITI